MIELTNYSCDPVSGKISHGARLLRGGQWKGYIRILVDNRLMFAHRVMWALCYGEWPNGDIDHINGIKDDNRLCNLRIVSRSVNALNVTRARSNNKSSGLLGVSRKSNGWGVYLQASGVRTFIGQFDTPEEASEAYKAAKAAALSGLTPTSSTRRTHETPSD